CDTVGAAGAPEAPSLATFIFADHRGIDVSVAIDLKSREDAVVDVAELRKIGRVIHRPPLKCAIVGARADHRHQGIERHLSLGPYHPILSQVLQVGRVYSLGEQYRVHRLAATANPVDVLVVDQARDLTDDEFALIEVGSWSAHDA